MPRIIIKRAAIADLKSIAAYIARDNPGRAITFVEEIRAAIYIWAENPLAGRERPDIGEGLRCFPHGNYVILYRPQEDGLTVVHVLHGKRDIRQFS